MKNSNVNNFNYKINLKQFTEKWYEAFRLPKLDQNINSTDNGITKLFKFIDIKKLGYITLEQYKNILLQARHPPISDK